MNNDLISHSPAPWHLWVVGGLLAIWNGLGAFDYVATIARFEPYLAQFPEEALSYYFSAPLWMFGIWGVSAFGGLMSAILLLMRKKLAIPIFVIALICSVIAIAYALINPAPDGANYASLGTIVIILALIVLVYMNWLKRRGILR